MINIDAYLTFNGNCREAMTFYKSCLGGELEMQVVRDSPMSGEWPPAVQDQVLHATLWAGDKILLLGSDMGAPGTNLNGTRVSISFSCTSEEELSNSFSRLSEGAKITHPIHDFYAGKIGAMVDKYGFSWLFYYHNGKADK
ncbi:VOC family protein [Chitinophaga solisilvae]|uniref:VOC family protein n=1 Tax=Chitinophaga solisilvae TaxID=1233460 RepID=A0A433WF32_9BACT|nr:VOC family protein [Chitinophaga solisilvae]NSL87324.1 VOC family protein [Chitinophaga solisilvae]